MALQRARIVGIVLSAVFVLTLVACGGSPSAAPVQDSGSTAAVDSSTAADPAAGQALFTSAGCIDCHAVTADGPIPEDGTTLAGFWAGKGIYGAILGNFKPINDENVAIYIREGGVGKVGKMPAHPDLTDEQIQQLIDYLKTLN